METPQQTETVVQCGPSTRQTEAGPSVITTRIGDIIMQLVPASCVDLETGVGCVVARIHQQSLVTLVAMHHSHNRPSIFLLVLEVGVARDDQLGGGGSGKLNGGGARKLGGGGRNLISRGGSRKLGGGKLDGGGRNLSSRGGNRSSVVVGSS
ncbi:unnamed protein product [Citrullus colocynthis]|uniref:Uncharacterized protein n=1 Tax=Citrullus colocynthis TaxID=252529 RepID=A0ABP0Z4V7_9ROSI